MLILEIGNLFLIFNYLTTRSAEYDLSYKGLQFKFINFMKG